MKRSKVEERFARGYTIEIYPTQEQINKLEHIFDLYRFVYNWALGKQIEARTNTGSFIAFIDMCKEFHDFRNDPNNEWIKDILLMTARFAIKQVDRACFSYANGQNKYPKFKLKRNNYKSFHVRGEEDRLRFKDGYVHFEGLDRNEWIYCGEHHIPNTDNIRYRDVTISTNGYGKYFLSTTVEITIPIIQQPLNEPIGIDMGIRNMMYCSDGTIYTLPDTSKYEKRKQRLDRQLGKARERIAKETVKLKGQSKTKTVPMDYIPKKSKTTLKRQEKYEKTCKRISNINKNAIYEAVNDIIKKSPSIIVIEDLKVNEMRESKYLSKKSKSNIMFYFIRKQLEYKANQKGIDVKVADMYYPSSQICHNCGSMKYMPLKYKRYICPVCGINVDRDFNAAINLRNLAY